MKHAEVESPIMLPGDSLVPLESIMCTGELNRRPSRSPDYQADKSALVAVAQALADSPRTILHTMTEKMLEIFHCDSAGFSLLTKDLVQGFFAYLLEKKALSRADQEKGRLRTFLLTSIQNFVMDQRDRSRMITRGGGHQILSFDEYQPEAEAAMLATADLDDVTCYDLIWGIEYCEAGLAAFAPSTCC
jgi:hypothetical protein